MTLLDFVCVAYIGVTGILRFHRLIILSVMNQLKTRIGNFTVTKEDNSSTSDLNKVNDATSPQHTRLLHIFKFIIGSPFIISIYVLFAIIHILIYIATGIGDYFTFHQQAYTSTSEMFVEDTYMFSPGGCAIGHKVLIVFLTYAAVYATIYAGFAVVSLCMKRDVYRSKLESILHLLNWVFFGVLYGVMSFIDVISNL